MKSRRPHLHLFLVLCCCSLATRGDELSPSLLAEAPLGEETPTVTSAVRPLELFLMATRPVLHYSYAHADSLLVQPGEPASTSVQSASISLNWHLGDSLELRYAPSWVWYSTDQLEDTLSHEVAARYRHSFVAWNVQAADRYSWSFVPLIETGQQTKQSSNNASLQAQRLLGTRLTLELGAGYAIRAVEDFAGYSDWSTTDWLHFQVTPTLSASIGAGYGFVNADDGPDMTYRQLHARLRWRIGDKLRLDARAGYEARSFLHSEVDDSKTPIYALEASYLLLESTSFFVQGDRRIMPSFFKGQVDRVASWEFGVRQRFFEHFFLDLSYLHRGATHHADVAGMLAEREDRGHFWQAKLSTKILRHTSLALSYGSKKNESTDPRYEFAGDQYGLELVHRF